MFLLIAVSTLALVGCNKKGDVLQQADVTTDEVYEISDISETETETETAELDSIPTSPSPTSAKEKGIERPAMSTPTAPSPALTGEAAVENKEPTPTPTPRPDPSTEDSNKTSYKKDYPEPEEKTITINGISYTGMVYSDGVIYAVFDGEDTLTFVGNGAISNRDDWCGMTESSRRKVRHIVIEKGITYIDDFEFCGDFLRPFINLESVKIEADLVEIRYGAFTDNPCLNKVVINGECQKVDDNAFDEGVTIE